MLKEWYTIFRCCWIIMSHNFFWRVTVQTEANKITKSCVSFCRLCWTCSYTRMHCMQTWKTWTHNKKMDAVNLHEVNLLFSHQNQRSVFNEVDVVLQTSVFYSWRNEKRLRPRIQKVFNQFLFTGIKALKCTTILVTSHRCQGDINKGVYQYAERTL